ncbi:hypothetical protein NI35_0065 [Salmonella enterica subsp. enterica serovar Cerro]|uniref:Uncharacterized protein n=2 Tax=Salmonella enterica I TaxID=59201 RepID=A0A6C8HAF0_SALET|nr:hypothetical protein GW13_PRO3670 [Salmonella enterica subsp. enterica serovar Cerro]EDX47573.1 hypothetical protein SeKA_A4400 [Salmonella enterica subsp. enterica serovar Kentucky str. CVM29188]EDX51070.1 hypothetical protein SNSL317_A1836 [Salmonella enterica subsp. enterica serovar Newport str. SL317]EDZ21792.1 hypothetical protein SeKB_A0175 [Salmonella enterica subsp. enterica serovar Kentucky str. CDC 191]EDZ35358.1 hypothetical protein SeH_A0341 [Salmonella enterica subsp. enterica s
MADIRQTCLMALRLSDLGQISACRPDKTQARRHPANQLSA